MSGNKISILIFKGFIDQLKGEMVWRILKLYWKILRKIN